MTDPTIIEAAARVLRKADLYDTRTPQEYSEIAEVVLAAVTPRIEAAALERAAKVAEDYNFFEPFSGAVDMDLLHHNNKEIAAAIRALKEQP